MDFSEDWRAIFPVNSSFFPPNLLQSNHLHFTAHSPPHTLFSSSSLLPHLPPITPPSLHLHSLQSILASQTPHITSLLPSISPLSPSSPFPSSNSLVSLPSHRPKTLHFFFPTGENSNYIAFLSIFFPSSSSSPKLILSQSGNVFIQSEGLMHPHHRISSLSAVPFPKTANQVREGYLMATTLYSVNYFQVETRVIGSRPDNRIPILVPLAKHGFQSPVIHASFSHHFIEESIVLLENGEIHWFNLVSKKSGKIRVRLNEEKESFEWLSCEFGAQPWMVMVASSKSVIMVDLRDGDEGQIRNLCKIDMLVSMYDADPIERNQKFLAFCKSNYNNFHFSVLAEFQLMLFDTRRQLDPILTWDHGLENPNFISMFELNQLADDSTSKNGFAILAGSFSTNRFNLFCYGPNNELEASSTSFLRAWGLPCSISLSGKNFSTGEGGLSNLFSKEGVFVKDFEFLRKNEYIVGFCIIPKELTSIENGFAVLRLMSFGRLELQNYHHSVPNEKNKILGEINGISKPCDVISFCPHCKRDEIPTRRYFLHLKYLNAYLDGELSETLTSNGTELKEISPSENLLELINDSINHTTSLSSFVNNANIPSNISEIAIKASLNNLKPDLMPFAFRKYSETFTSNIDSSFQLLEVSRSDAENGGGILSMKPFRRGQKWSVKTGPPKDSLVGPILPVPFLLSLEERERSGKDSSFDNKCEEILEIVSPPISIAETEDANDKSKSYFVYEPECVNKNKMVCKSEKYDTFICGVNGEKGKGVIGSEFFDLGEINLGFDSKEIEVNSSEKKLLEKLKNQFSSWLSECKPYQDFCINSRIL